MLIVSWIFRFLVSNIQFLSQRSSYIIEKQIHAIVYTIAVASAIGRMMQPSVSYQKYEIAYGEVDSI